MLLTLGAGPPSASRGVVIPTPDVITDFPIGEPSGQQPSVYVYDLSNGFPLYEKNPDTPNLWPASICKLMTLLLAWEKYGAVWESASLTFTAADVAQPIPPLIFDAAGFLNGDVTTPSGCAYGISLPSGFEGCQLFARLIGSDGNGTGGVAGFITRMNARALELGMTNTTFTTSFGAGKSFAPDVTRDISTARDITKLCIAAMTIPALRGIALTPSFDIPISAGPNSPTLPVVHSDTFVNGPFGDPQESGDPRDRGGKIGTWLDIDNAVKQYSRTGIMITPAGYEVVFTTLGSVSDMGRMLDQTGLMYAVTNDFPYLATGVATTDPNFSSVKLLVGGDGAVVDESGVGRSLTVTGVTGTGDPIVQGSTGSLVFDNVNDEVSAADAADLEPGSAAFTAEQWIRFNGTQPGGGVEIVPFSKTAGSNFAWAWNYIDGAFNVFISSTGSNWVFRTIPVDADSRATLFNGATRHFVHTRSGNSFYFYLNGQRLTTGGFAVTVFNGTAPVRIGLATISPLGTIDDSRLTMGVARYTDPQFGIYAIKFPRA